MSRHPLAWGHVAQCLRAVTKPPPLCSSASLFLAGPVHSPGPQQGTFLQARDLGAAPANRVSFRGKHTCAQDVTEHGPRTQAAGGPRGGGLLPGAGQSGLGLPGGHPGTQVQGLPPGPMRNLQA